jgi:hypothetical protein
MYVIKKNKEVEVIDRKSAIYLGKGGRSGHLLCSAFLGGRSFLSAFHSLKRESNAFPQLLS